MEQQSTGLQVDVNSIIDELTNENAELRKQLALTRAQVRALSAKVAESEQEKIAEGVQVVPPAPTPIRNKRAAARKRT